VQAIRYVDALNNYYREQGHPPYRWSVHDSAPLQAWNKPLTQACVSLLTSGGISQCSMPPFEADARNNHRLDEIPATADSCGFQIHDNYYDHTDAEMDLNCVFPIDRLRELAFEGVIGRVAPRFWSGFMGRIYDRTRLLTETVPAFIQQLQKDEVDLLIAVPA